MDKIIIWILIITCIIGILVFVGRMIFVQGVRTGSKFTITELQKIGEVYSKLGVPLYYRVDVERWNSFIKSIYNM